MFERYTENARRVIFFARYEASQFASKYIESEHLLLGLLREDKALAHYFLKTHTAIESIRNQVEAHTPLASGISTSVDLPLSQQSKRILAYGAEEAESFRHRNIDSLHLLLGMLRESKSVAAKLLAERDVRIEAVRAYAAQLSPDTDERLGDVDAASSAELPPLLVTLLSDREKAGDITVATDATVARQSVDVAIYEGRDVLTDGDPINPAEPAAPASPAEEIAGLRRKIRSVHKSMDGAIANHEFGKARLYSDDERRIRKELSQLRDRVAKMPAGDSWRDPVPFLCILLLGNESLSELRSRIEDYLNEGVAHIWILDPTARRVYTATTREGLRESTDGMLRVEHPRLELEWKTIFD